MKTNSIEVRNFSKKFGDFTAVDNISFDVEQGTIFAFLGPNGAGKSTTINTLCTIQEKTEGTLKINGNDVSKQKDLVRKDIGIVFQDSTMDGKLTVEENLKLHCDFYKVPKLEMKERIDFVLDLVDIKSRKKSPVDSLSGGMKRRECGVRRYAGASAGISFCAEPGSRCSRGYARVFYCPGARTGGLQDIPRREGFFCRRDKFSLLLLQDRDGSADNRKCGISGPSCRETGQT